MIVVAVVVVFMVVIAAKKQVRPSARLQALLGQALSLLTEDVSLCAGREFSCSLLVFGDVTPDFI